MDIEYEKLVGRKIRNLREKQDLTQEQLSAKLQTMGCDITRSALAKIEVGQRHIYLDELKLIKELLNTNYTTLLDET
ncbi:MAG: helix-turn-helix transcriptional regulator [Eubacteriales bacterium]|nr:helix-turn-helix transcriptional regulator [Eubacteriales bacterium]